MTKIILVEDSKFLRMATERALARAGYIVITADEGPKAIELAKKDRPDVMLLDSLLPGMTGPDVLKALKKDSGNAATSVIAFTGLSQKECNTTPEGWSLRVSGKICAGPG
jgi:CheY-like chemotaxis protein